MKKNWLLILALTIGTIFRLYQLGVIPNALTWDEAALGYNAYSILKTGRDEFGKILPIIFKSFGDYKPGLYVYLAVPSVAILGLNEFGIRLPGALFGILAIWGVYLLMKELFREEKNVHLLASLTALVLALMPLHIHFSRGAWETSVMSTILIFALFFLLKFIRTGKYLWLAVILSLLTFITYQAAKIVTPLIIGFTILVFWKAFFSQISAFIKKPLNKVFLLVSFAITIYFFIGTVSGDSANRLKRLSIFSFHPETSETLFDNPIQQTIRLIATRYLNHLSPKLLFYEGIAVYERGHLPNLGVLQPFDFITIFFGLIFLVKMSNKKIATFIIGLLLLSPIPGSLTLSNYSTVRSFFMVVPLSLLDGLGFYYLATNLKPFFYGVCFITLVTVIYMSENLFFHANYTYAHEYQYGYREAVQFINKYPGTKTIMTDVYGQPYIFYLFYSKYNPAEYQKQNNFVSGGLDVGRVTKIDNIEFHQFGEGDILSEPDTIFIGTVGNIKNDFDYNLPIIEAHDSINSPDDLNIFRMVKTKAFEK